LPLVIGESPGRILALATPPFVDSSHAQTTQLAKSEIGLDVEVSKDGTVIGRPVLRVAAVGTATLTLTAGISIKISVSHGAAGR
jgi:hypothetical protein